MISVNTTKESKPLSIVTVVYNARSDLRITIDSVLNQSFTNFEYIIIDGGSTDGTVDLIKEYEDKIDFWISEPDRGLYNAMNKGLDYCSGDLCQFLNAGDFYTSKTVLSDFIELLTYPYHGLIFTRSKIFSSTDDFFYLPSYEQNVSSNWVRRNTPNHQSIFFQKGFYTDHRYDESYRITGDSGFIWDALNFHDYKAHFIDLLVVEFPLGGISSRALSLKELCNQILESTRVRRKHVNYKLIDNFTIPLRFLVKNFFLSLLGNRFHRFLVVLNKYKNT